MVKRIDVKFSVYASKSIITYECKNLATRIFTNALYLLFDQKGMHFTDTKTSRSRALEISFAR